MCCVLGGWYRILEESGKYLGWGSDTVCSLQHVNYCLNLPVFPPPTVRSSSPFVLPFQILHNAAAGPIAARLVAAAVPLDMIAPLVPSFAVVPSSAVAVAAAVASAVAAPWAFAWERASSSVALRTATPSGLASCKVPSYSPVDTLAAAGAAVVVL